MTALTATGRALGILAAALVLWVAAVASYSLTVLRRL